MLGSGHPLALTLLLVTWAAQATAGPATLQFEGVDAPGFVEQGFALDSDAAIVADPDGVPAPAMRATVEGQAFALVAVDGRSFDAHTLALGELDPLAGPRQLTFEGERRGGGTVVVTFTTDGIEGFESFDFPSRFSDVTRLRWLGDPALRVDALELSRGIDFTRAVAGSPSYLEDGMLLRGSSALVLVESGAPAPALTGPALGEIHILEPVNGGSFTVSRFHAAALAAPAEVSITFVGTKHDGSTVFASFLTSDTSVEFEAFDFPPGFAQLARLEWSDAGDVAVDGFEIAFDPGLDVQVRATHTGRATVDTSPSGGGRPVASALSWDGIPGSAPTEVDATVQARVFLPAGAPAPGVGLALRTSLGSVVWCDGGDHFDADTDAEGLAYFSGAPRAGGATTPEGGERTEVFVPDHPGSRVHYDARLVASRSDGNLYVLDPSSGLASPLCLGTLPGGSTEIAFDPRSQTLWVQPPGLGFAVMPYDLQTCAPSGPVIDNGAAMNGMEFVGDDLYGVGITAPCGASSLYRIDVVTGTTTLVGPTGLDVPIAGLALDANTGVLYGVTGCTSTGGSDLVTVDLASGEALVVASLGVSLGSIAYGSNGALYGVGNNQNGGSVYVIDPVAAVATSIGASAVGGLTGLALVTGPALDLQFQGVDLDADLDVDLGDVGVFALDFDESSTGGATNFRSDFYWNGRINLQDIGVMSTGVGAVCAGLPKSTGLAVARDARLGLWFDSATALRTVDADAGSIVTAYLVLESGLVREGVSAWAVRMRTTSNVEVLEWTLPRGSIDLGRDDARIVGTAGLRAARGDALVLATISLRVRDEAPAYFHLEGVPAVAHGATAPAIAFGPEHAVFEVHGPFGPGAAVAALNGTLDAVAAQPPSSDEHDLRNSPNPFNPATELHFALPAGGRAALRIFDLAGRRVRVLDGGELAAGQHALRWDGRDAHGRMVSSGVYLGQLVVDDQPRGNLVKMLMLQ